MHTYMEPHTTQEHANATKTNDTNSHQDESGLKNWLDLDCGYLASVMPGFPLKRTVFEDFRGSQISLNS